MSSTLTDLTAATTWSGTDLFYSLVAGNSRKIAAESFAVAETQDILSLRRGANGKIFRVYMTFTDSSNYERLALVPSTGNMFIAAETAGTGTDNINITLLPAGAGRVEISSSSVDSSLLITNTNASSNTFQVNNTTTTGGSLNVGSFTGSAITSGGTTYLSLGKANTTGNWAAFGFTWIGDNDAANKVLVAFNSGNTLLSLASAGTARLFETISTPAGGSTNARLLFGSTAGFGIYIGSGTPSVSAAQGSLYLRSDGSSTSTRLYVNTNGSTTWTNVTTAG